jgi:hypothetical protein
MHAIERFSLERHAGPYESWPRRTRLFDRGAPTQLAIPAYVLLHQFEVPGGFLLVLDDDCPHEEFTTFCLLGADLRLLSRRWLGVPYASFFLRAIEWVDERRFVADFGDEPAAATAWERARSAYHGDWAPARVGFVLRSRGIPYLFPRLALRNPRRWPAACARFETMH